MSAPAPLYFASALLIAGALVPPGPALTGQATPAPVQGTITGTVDLGGTATTRRTTNRYRGRGASRAQRGVQPLPAVVFLEGAVSGGRGNAAGRAVAASRSGTLVQQDTAFAPSLVAVQVGETVEFPNHDAFFHNVFSYSDPKRFDLGRYPEGESKSVVFDRPGIVQVFCEVHEHMRAVVVVTENPYHAVVSEDGTFTIEGVPTGTHRLVVWHSDTGRTETLVEVRNGRTTDLTLALD